MSIEPTLEGGFLTTADQTALPMEASMQFEDGAGRVLNATEDFADDTITIEITDSDDDFGRAITLTKANARRFAAFINA